MVLMLLFILFHPFGPLKWRRWFWRKRIFYVFKKCMNHLRHYILTNTHTVKQCRNSFNNKKIYRINQALISVFLTSFLLFLLDVGYSKDFFKNKNKQTKRIKNDSRNCGIFHSLIFFLLEFICLWANVLVSFDCCRQLSWWLMVDQGLIQELRSGWNQL